jgi:PII-like signaling protein
MQLPTEATLLRIFIGESDKWEHKPLYEVIVLKAREAHLARPDGFRKIEPAAHGENSPALDGFAHRH